MKICYRSLIHALSILSTPLLLTGCVTNVAGLVKSKDFTYSNVTSGRITIGGVVDVNKPLDTGEANSLAQLLKTAIIEERPNLRTLPTTMLKSELGGEKYNQILESNQKEGEVGPQVLKLLKGYSRSRYVVFALMDQNDVDKNRQERIVTDDKGNDTGRSKITTTAERRVAVQFRVVDTSTGTISWSGSINKTERNAQEFQKREKGALVAMIEAASGSEDNRSADERYPYPEPPKLRLVLAKVFEGFAENLPEE